MIVRIVVWCGKIGFGEYYFSDTPTSADDNIPALAKGQMAKKKLALGSMLHE